MNLTEGWYNAKISYVKPDNFRRGIKIIFQIENPGYTYWLDKQLSADPGQRPIRNLLHACGLQASTLPENLKGKDIKIYVATNPKPVVLRCKAI